MDVQRHIESAEEYIEKAEERDNDPSWALVEVELAEAHLLAAGVKMAYEAFGGKSKIGSALSLVSKLAR